MKEKLIFLILTWGMVSPCLAQLTIEECYRKAQANYPLIRQYDLIEKTKDYNLANANKSYLPQVTFSAQATYQSDVTEIPIDLERIGITGIEIPTVDKDQYKLSLEVNQTIWDGGTVRSQKEMFRTQAEIEQRNLEVNIYAINDRVNQLYFGILLFNAQIGQNQILQEELQCHCRQVAAYIENGLANASDLDALRVDLLQAKQNEVQLSRTREAYIAMLSQLIGEEISGETEFVKPAALRPLEVEVHRPELAFFDAQIRNWETQNDYVKSGVMPRLGLFVTGGYGKPGLDMLENDFKAYYVAGVRLSWDLGSFYTKKNNREKIQAGIRSVEAQRETFLFNTELDRTQRNAVIDKCLGQLKYDDEIVALRHAIKLASEAKMANGTLSGTDLARDIHAEQAAIQDRILHEMELLLAIYNLKYVINN